MYQADTPIKSKKEDKLKRSNFSKNLAKTILSYNSNESLVIGLMGKWGSGKTSIINLIEEEIETVSKRKKTDENKSIFIYFKPWRFSGVDQLISYFFSAFSKALKCNSYLKETGTILGEIGSEWIPKKYGGFILKKIPFFKPESIEEKRGKITEELSKFNGKIIIAIDDIDRLTSIEIAQIFQLVKALADFPNTVYILSFDRKIVIEALENIQTKKGSDYLEKIIQVPINIPQASKSDVHGVLLEHLDKIIKKNEINFGSYENDWRNTYGFSLSYLFQNIRDVIRFLNVFQFNFSVIKDEINFIDFLIITTLQVLFPNTYENIKNNKHIFVENVNENNLSDIDKKTLEKIISKIPKKYEDPVKKMIGMLFPRMNHFFGNTIFAPQRSDDSEKALRICCEKRFDTYFQFSLPSSVISQEEIKTFLQLKKQQDIEDFFGTMIQSNRIKEFLRTLEFYTETDIPKEKIATMLSALFNIGDKILQLKEESGGFLDLPISINVAIINDRLIARMQSGKDKFALLKAAIEKTENSIETITSEVFHLDERIKKDEKKELLSKSQLNQLKKMIINKIYQWSKKKEFAKMARLPFILFRWKDWGDRKKLSTFIKKITISDNGLIEFVEKFIYRGRGHYIGSYGRTEKEANINLKDLGELISLDEIAKKFKKMKKKKNTINIFLDNYEKTKKN